MEIYAHINFFESRYPRLKFPLEQVFEAASEMGYDGIELRAPMEGVPYTIEEAASLARKNGMKGVTFGGNYNAMSDDASVRRAETERFLDCVRRAAAVGTRFLNCQTGRLLPEGNRRDYVNAGSAVATGEQFRWAVEMLREAGEAAAKQGVTLCLETHPCYLHDRAAATKRLVEAVGLDNVKVNLDWVNIMVIGEETEEQALRLLGPHIRYLHLKNGRRVAGEFFPTPLSDGEVDTLCHLRTLTAEYGFDGIVVPEFARPGDRRYFARRDLEYLREVLSCLDRFSPEGTG